VDEDTFISKTLTLTFCLSYPLNKHSNICINTMDVRKSNAADRIQSTLTSNETRNDERKRERERKREKKKEMQMKIEQHSYIHRDHDTCHQTTPKRKKSLRLLGSLQVIKVRACMSFGNWRRAGSSLASMQEGARIRRNRKSAKVHQTLGR